MTRLYDSETLFEEVAFVAYHFGWSHDEVLRMPHWERQRWCEEISRINERMNGSAGADGGPGEGPDGGTFLDAEGDGTVIRNSLDDLDEA